MPLWPRNSAFRKITAKTPTTTITKMAEARSLTWTACSEAVGAALTGLAGCWFFAWLVLVAATAAGAATTAAIAASSSSP